MKWLLLLLLLLLMLLLSRTPATFALRSSARKRARGIKYQLSGRELPVYVFCIQMRHSSETRTSIRFSTTCLTALALALSLLRSLASAERSCFDAQQLTALALPHSSVTREHGKVAVE